LKTILSRRDNVNEMHNNTNGSSNDHYYATELIYLAMEAEEVMLSSFVTSTSSTIRMNEDDENDELHLPQLLQPNIASVNLILEVWSNAIQIICNHNKSLSSTNSATAGAISPPMFAALVKNKRITVQKAVETAEALLFQLEQSHQTFIDMITVMTTMTTKMMMSFHPLYHPTTPLVANPQNYHFSTIYLLTKKATMPFSKYMLIAATC